MPAAKAEKNRPRTLPRAALLVSGSERGREQLKDLLAGSAYRVSVAVGNGGEARRSLLTAGADLVVVNAPLVDEFGADLACDAAERGLNVILLVKGELVDEVRAKVNPAGVLTLGKPFSKERFHEALTLLDVFRPRMAKLEDENRTLRMKLEEVKVVCRAKCLLVEYRKLTEPEAHRLIEKEAMDRRLTRRAVAERIIKEWE